MPLKGKFASSFEMSRSGLRPSLRARIVAGATNYTREIANLPGKVAQADKVNGQARRPSLLFHSGLQRLWNVLKCEI